MSTTTIRLDDELKARVVEAAGRQGLTPHAFILEAIARTVGQAEEDEAFTREADDRWQRLLKAGDSLPLSAAQAHLDARLQGGKPRQR